MRSSSIRWNSFSSSAGVRRSLLAGARSRSSGVQLVAREMKLAELEFEINPLGDLHRVAHRTVIGGKRLCHLGRRLDVEFVGIETPARLVGHRLAGLDAEQDFVGAGVFAMQIMAIVGRDHRQPDAGWRSRAGLRCRDRGACCPAARYRSGRGTSARKFSATSRALSVAPRAHRARQFARQASGKRDQPLGVLLRESPCRCAACNTAPRDRRRVSSLHRFW